MRGELANEVERFAQRMCAPEPAWWRRLWVRINADALDRRLADGANALHSPLLALRARQLTDPQARRRLAIDIDAILIYAHEAVRRPQLFRQLSPFNMPGVCAAHDDLGALRDRLRDARAVSECGAAMTSLLLRSRSGPLYDEDAPLPLRYCVRMALLSLE